MLKCVNRHRVNFGLRDLARQLTTNAVKQTMKEPKKSLFGQLKPFLKFARPEFRLVGGSLVLLLISSTVTMSVPFSMGAIIDIVMENLDAPKSSSDYQVADENSHKELVKSLLAKTGSLTGLFSFLGGIFVIGAAANGGRQVLMAKASENVIKRLRNELFSRMITRDIMFHDKNRAGELISRLSTDTAVVGKTLTSNIADGLRSMVMSTTGLGAMIYVNPSLTMTTMSLVPVISIISMFYGRNISKQLTDSSADLTKFAEERLSSIRTVRAFSRESHEMDMYDRRSSNVFNLGMKEGYASALFFSSMGLSGNIVILAILYYGGSLVAQGLVSIGELTSFFLYTAYVGSSIAGLGSWFSTLNKGAGAGERIFKLLEEPERIETLGGKKPAISGAVEFRNISFVYPIRPDAPILKGLSFSLNPGEKVAIVGHSGSGKSTIAQMLLRFYDPNEGSILIDDVPLTELDIHWFRSEIIGLVAQEPTLFADSIKTNIQYGNLAASDEEIIQAAKMANAHEFITTFPDGYDTYVGDRGLALSGGQKQRIAIARALLKNPKILVLDEASSALDNVSEALVQEALDRLIQGRTVITIAHRLSTIKLADRILMISNGKIIESGTFDELLNRNGAFSAMVGQISEE